MTVNNDGQMPPIPPDTGIILVDHGSRMQAANEMMCYVQQLFEKETGATIVETAHMELAQPTIAQAFARCVVRGARKVVVHPYFLSPGRHSTTDIPELASEAAAAYPGIPYYVTAPLGLDKRLAQVIERRILEALGTLTEETP